MAISRQNQYDAYKDTEITTANQSKLIIMLYDGAIRFLRIAEAKMDFHSYDVVNTNIIKAQDIITELMVSLNMEAGGAVAANLLNLYAYMKKRLIEANMQKDAGMVKEVIGHMETLRAAWEQAGQKSGPVQVETPMARSRAAGVSFSIQG
jgi:flagellar secretion chaperone FliS